MDIYRHAKTLRLYLVPIKSKEPAGARKFKRKVEGKIKMKKNQ